MYGKSKPTWDAECPHCGTGYTFNIGPPGAGTCRGCGKRLSEEEPDTSEQVTEEMLDFTLATMSERSRMPMPITSNKQIMLAKVDKRIQELQNLRQRLAK